MPENSPDQTLLLGLLAYLNQFVRREQLLEALGEWKRDKTQSLVVIFTQRGWLTAERRQLLEALAEEWLAQTGDAVQSLAALSSIGSIRTDLEQLGDAEISASMAQIVVSATGPNAVPSSDDPYRTQLPANRSEPTVPAKFTSGFAAARFRVLRFHARGGLGQVSLAVDEELGREVALKEIQAQRADDPLARDRFVREAEITGQLEHPGIVPVYGLGNYADGRPYYAMRFIEGDNLLKHVQAFHQQAARRDFQSTDFRRLLARFIDVCQAIQYAHDRKVLHRDLKPENIMLGKYGETLVVDWGLAKATGSGNPELTVAGEKFVSTHRSGSGETLDGSTFGTPEYMSPEQAAGRIQELDKATDIYSLGATLYCLLTGRPPFRGKDHPDILQTVREGRFPPPRRICPAAPKALESICLKAMAKEPGQRYAAAGGLASDLEQWLADSPVSAHRDSLLERASRFVRKHRAWVLGGGALLATIAVALAIGLFAVQREQKRTLAAQKVTQLQLAESERNQGLQLCRDGEVDDGLLWLARSLETAPPDATDLRRSIRWNIAAWKQHLSTLEQLTPIPQGDQFGGVSPDGQWFLLERKLPPPPGYQRRPGDPEDTHSEVRICRFPSGEPAGEPLPRVWVRQARFSPDSKRLVLTRIADKRHRGLVFQLKDGEWIEQKTPAEINTFAFRRPFFQFLPDGRLITLSFDASASTQLAVVEVLSGKVLGKLPFGERNHPSEHDLRMSEDGAIILTRDEKSITLWNVALGERRCPPLIHSSHVDQFALSPAGDRVATAWDESTEAGDAAAFVQYWDAATGAKIGGAIRLGEDENHPTVLDFRNQGEQLFVATMAETLRALGPTGKPLAPPLKNVYVNEVEVSRDGNRAVSSGRLWDVDAGRFLGQDLPSFRLSADERHGFAPTEIAQQRAIQRWRLPTGGLMREPIPSNAKQDVDFVFSPDSRRMLSIDEVTGGVRGWNPRTGEQCESEFTGPYGIVTPVLTDGGLLAFGSHPNLSDTQLATLHLYDVQTGKPVSAALPQYKMRHRALALDPQQRRLAAVSDNGVISVYDLELGKVIAGPWKHEVSQDYHRVHLCFSPSGRQLAVAHHYANLPDARLSLWSLDRGNQIGDFHEVPKGLATIAFSPDGATLAAIGGGETHLWDALSGERRSLAIAYDSGARFAVFNPLNGLLLIAHQDRTVRSWDISTGLPQGLPLQLQDLPGLLSIAPARELLFVGTLGGGYVWDLNTRTQVGPVLRPGTRTLMSPDGRTIVSHYAGEIRFWEVPDPVPDDPLAVRQELETATGLKMNAQRALEPLSASEILQRLEAKK